MLCEPRRKHHWLQGGDIRTNIHARHVEFENSKIRILNFGLFFFVLSRMWKPDPPPRTWRFS